MVDDESPLASGPQLVRALGVRTHQGVLDLIEDAVEPLVVYDVHWGRTAFEAGIGNRWLHLEFPFSVDEFWEALTDVGMQAREAQDEEVRDQAFADLAERADNSGGVVALTMADLLVACQIHVPNGSRRVPIRDRRAVAGHLRSYGFVASELPSAKTHWILLWLKSAPIAAKLSARLPKLLESNPELTTPKRKRSARVRG